MERRPYVGWEQQTQMCISRCQAAESEGKRQNFVLGFREGYNLGLWKHEDPGGLFGAPVFAYLVFRAPILLRKYELVWEQVLYAGFYPMVGAWLKAKGWYKKVFDLFLVLSSDDLASIPSPLLHWGRHLALHSNGLHVFRLNWLCIENAWKPHVYTE